MAEPIISIEHLEFYYDKGQTAEHHALKDINLVINRGEYAAFFGPSGCGKSTLLSSISGIERPESGAVNVDGKNIMLATQDQLALYRQTEVGIIFQNFNLLPSLTVLGNVAMPMMFLGVSTKDREKKAMETLERLNLSQFANRYPFELSGGQQQRVGIARALVNTPPIILADEPLGNLDSENANRVLEFLKELNEKDGKTIIMVTHEAWSLRDAQKIFHIRDGTVLKTEDKKRGVVVSASGKVAEAGAATSGDRAKMVSPLLLRGYPEAQIQRLENFLTKLMDKEISLDEFVSWLDKPLKLGGAGLWLQKARRIGELMGQAIEQEEALENVLKELHDHPEMHCDDEIKHIRLWIFEERKAKMDEAQTSRVNALINSRIRGNTSSQEFLAGLSLAKSKGGPGIPETTALKISERMELIMGGVHPLKDKAQSSSYSSSSPTVPAEAKL